MYSGVWKTDDKDNAIFIDIDTDIKPKEEDGLREDIDDFKEYSKWNELPDLLLENIFSYLTIREKYWASMTCRNWYFAFHLSTTWSTFVLDDYTLTRRKFNYYSGWQYVLDHFRTMQCLTTVGKHFRYLIFEPMMNFYNLYEFMNMLSYYAEEKGRDNTSVDGVGKLIRGLKFIFPCHMRQKQKADNIRLFGTGGQILASLKRLMSNLESLTHLQLVDLMLEYKDARYLLDDVCNKCCLQLETLILVNTTKETYQLLHPGVFLNLRVLVISPQNIGEELVELLGYTKLRHMHILSNTFSPPPQGCKAVSAKCWDMCKKENPYLSVHLECYKDILWQDRAPVKSIIFNSTKLMVETQTVLSAVEFYGKELQAFVYHGFARFHRPKSFHDRADSMIVMLCRQCPKLNTLVIRERISTASVLLIATTAKYLTRLLVRKNAVIIKTDWPMSDEWSDSFYHWLKINSRSYESVEREVSQILGYRWTMLSDTEWKKLHFRPY